MFSQFINLTPNNISKNKTLFLIAVLAFSIPALMSFFYVAFDSEAVYLIGNEYQISQLKKSFDPALYYLRPKQSLTDDLVMLNYYIVNNTVIGFVVFFAGMFFGIGGLLVLAFQGISMGLRVGYISQLGYHETLWPFLIGHTSFEVIAIIISAFCGMSIGVVFLHRENKEKLATIKKILPEIAMIMIMALFMFLAAALVETFWSSNTNIHSNAKYVAGIIGWLLLIYYLKPKAASKN